MWVYVSKSCYVWTNSSQLAGPFGLKFSGSIGGRWENVWTKITKNQLTFDLQCIVTVCASLSWIFNCHYLWSTWCLWYFSSGYIAVIYLITCVFSFPLLTAYQAGLGDCLIALAFMMEASTPFVSARAILELLGNIILGAEKELKNKKIQKQPSYSISYLG